MWAGKLKAVTFSFDDGVAQDIRTIEILNKYSLKGTFNINSAMVGQKNSFERFGVTVIQNRNAASDIPRIYEGHEIAAHTLSHPLLPSLPDEEIIRQVEEDRLALSNICGYDVVGLAYPCGGQNHDDRVASLVQSHTGIKYARTIISSNSFDLQKDLMRFNPTVYICDDNLFDIAERFISSKTDEPQLLYIWGHAYELDTPKIPWEKFEELCCFLSGHSDVFYGTNMEILL